MRVGTFLEAARANPDSPNWNTPLSALPQETRDTVRNVAADHGIYVSLQQTPNDLARSLETIDRLSGGSSTAAVESATRAAPQADSAASQAFADARATPGTSTTASTPNADVTATLGAPSTNDTGTINDIVNQGQSSVASGLSRSARNKPGTA